MKPVLVTVITQPSFGIRSSIRTSPSNSEISHLRSSAYEFLNSLSSLLINSSRTLSLSMILRRSFIIFINSAYSASIFSRSIPVSWYNRRSNIALACLSLREYFVLNFSLASRRFDDARIVRTKSSKLSNAIL